MDSVLEPPRILLHHVPIPAALDPLQEAALLALLPEPRRSAWQRQRDPAARIATLCGIDLLCRLATRAGLAAPRVGDLVYPERGKPAWRDGPTFSIAHAGGVVACALASSSLRLGLDIEPSSRVTARVLRRIASPEELMHCRALGWSPAELWTSKEAVVKATGDGVFRLAEVRVEAGRAHLDGLAFHLLRPALLTGFACTVASDLPLALEMLQVDD